MRLVRWYISRKVGLMLGPGGEHTDNGTFLNDEARALGYRVLGWDKTDVTM
jgi:hypothetical protein